MKKYHFKFICNGFDEATFTLLQFDGIESISQLYQFNIELSTTNTLLDSDELIQSESRLEIYHDNQLIRTIHGVLVALEESKFLSDGVLYKAQLAPKVWMLNQYETNEVYLAQNIQETLETILKEMGLESAQYRFDLTQKYRSWPFRLQYRESHLDFLHRIIEREGIYYYFEQLEDTEVIVFCDALQMVQSFSQQALTFQSAGGINLGADIAQVSSFICRRQRLPNRITLRDFNEESPSLDVRGEADIDVKGVGEINIYGLNIESPEEGAHLAEIHANAYRCRANEYMGESQTALMSSGYRMDIQQHPKAQYNEQEYLIVEIQHAGSNPDAFRQDGQEGPIPEAYHNHFIAVDTSKEFAPRLQSVKPEIKGTLNAIIDAEASGEYAELDEYGRYKVKLPFDRRNEDDGKASHWVRMMQPYGGSGEGMHFPLRKGTRVLLSFIGGDPDRPVIAGTISDCGEQASIVNATNQTNSMIKSSGGNKIELEDMKGNNRIKLESPTNDTYLHLGAPNHDGSGYVLVTAGIERIDVSGGQRLTYTVGSSSYSALFSYDSTSTYALNENVKYLNKVYKSLTAGNINNSPDTATTHWQEQASYDLSTARDPADKSGMFNFGNKSNITNAGGDLLDTNKEISGKYLVERKSGPQYKWNSGEQYNFYATGRDHFPNNQNRHYYFGNHWEVSCSRVDVETEVTGVSGPSDVVNTMISFGLDGIKQYESGDIPVDSLDSLLTTKVTEIFNLAKSDWTVVVTSLNGASPQIDLGCVNTEMDSIKDAAGVSLNTIMMGAPTHYYQRSRNSPSVLHYIISSDQKHSFTVIQDANVDSVRGVFQSSSTINGRITTKLSEILDAKISGANAITAAEITATGVTGYTVEVVNARFDELKQALKTQCLGNIGGVLMPIFQDEGDDDSEAKGNILGFELTSRSRQCFTESGIVTKKNEYKGVFEGIKTGAITHIKSNLNNIFSDEQAGKIDDLTKWTKLLSWSKVEVARTDSFNLQEGNIFDFGGYWNYNLGNSYAENYMDQSVNINQKEAEDLIDVGGPDWTKLKIPRSYFENVTPPSDMSWYCSDGVWVEKTFGGKAYDYNFKKKSIEVNNRCNDVEVSVGGTSHEVKFNGTGFKVHEEKSGGGISEEWSSTPDGNYAEYEKVDKSGAGKVTETRTYAYGNPVSYEIVRQPAPGTSFSFKGDGLPTLSMSMETNLGATALSTTLGLMDNSVKMEYTAMTNSMEISGVFMENEMKINLPGKFENKIEVDAGSMLAHMKTSGLLAGVKAAALQLQMENLIEISDEKMKLKNKIMEIESNPLNLENGMIDLKTKALTLLN
jgi:type VI secretion system VgrG family protein